MQAEVVGVTGVVGAPVGGAGRGADASGSGVGVLVEDAGLILAFTVDDLEGELARLRAEGAAITMPLTVEEWGERAFQVTDPNGIIIQLMDWAARPGNQPPGAAGPARG